jgi:NTP pyrophosphatase (non-canonical NTP hydrolase)
MVKTEELTKKIKQFRKERGWSDQKDMAPKNQAIALVMEATELLECFAWSDGHQVPEEEKQHLEEELIDVLYWVLVIADDQGIDIDKAFKQKMKKNIKKYPIEKEDK